MELEEAIKHLKALKCYYQEVIKEDDNRLSFEAIETVLQAYEDSKGVIEQLVYTIENSIPKKKVEDKLEELKDEFNNYEVGVNCSQDNYYAISEQYSLAEEKLRELLEV